MRIDVELANRGLFKSRQKAKEAIVGGQIKLNGRICIKPSTDVLDTDSLEICGNTLPYVGRGGLKLERILDTTGISLENKTCIDIGASTGGFTDCMLMRGAAFVYAVDVGSGQLAEKLVQDNRVMNMEKTDIRNVMKENLDREIDFISADVSFISLKLVMPKMYELLSEQGSAVVLIKPQFEAGKKNIGKNGIVKDPRVHRAVLEDVLSSAESTGFGICALDFSPVTGGSGNIEYLCMLKKTSCTAKMDIVKTVSDAFENLRKGRP